MKIRESKKWKKRKGRGKSFKTKKEEENEAAKTEGCLQTLDWILHWNMGLERGTGLSNWNVGLE